MILNFKRIFMLLVGIPLMLWGNELSPTLNALLQSQYTTFKIHSFGAFSRFGELRRQNFRNSVWISDKFGFVNQASNGSFSSAKTDFNHFLIGSDTYFKMPEALLYVGGLFDVISTTIQSPSFQGKNESYAGGAYFTYLRDNRFYFDALAKVYYTSNTFFFNHPLIPTRSEHFGRANFYLGLEMGQRFALGFSIKDSFVFIEPVLQVQSGYIPKITTGNIGGSNARLQWYVPFAMQGSVAIGKEFNELFAGDIKGGISLAYDYQMGGEIQVRDSKQIQDFVPKMHDVRLGVFVEADFILNDYARFFVQTQSTFFGAFDVNYAATLGVRVQFGTLATHKMNVQKGIYWQSKELQ